jgi:hypothetical protein
MAEVTGLPRWQAEFPREVIPKPGSVEQPEAADDKIFEDLRIYFQLAHQNTFTFMDLKLGAGIQARFEGEAGFRLKESLSLILLKAAAAIGVEEHQVLSELEGGLHVGKFGPVFVGKWLGGNRVPAEQKFGLFGVMQSFLGMGLGVEFELRKREQLSVIPKEEPWILHTEIQALTYSIQPRVNLSNLSNLVDKLLER